MEPKSMKRGDPTFGANKLATTVGANGLEPEIVVSQPRILIPVEEEIEYEFDQQKYEEYLSSSSGSSSSRQFKEESALGPSPNPAKMAATKSLVPKSTGSPKLASSVLKVTADGEVTLSKRARQRRRQRQAHQLAKALEQVDGLHCYANSEFRKSQPPRIASSKPSTDEWVLVKRTRSTLKERIQKRRARAAQARALARKAQDSNEREVDKKPQKSRQVWVPKPKPVQRSECNTVAPSFQCRRTPSHLGPEIGGRVCTPVRPSTTQQRPDGSKQTRTPQCTCSCAVHKKIPVDSRLGVHDEAKEPVKNPRSQGGGLKRATPDVTLDRSKATTNKLEKVNKVLHPQKKTCPSKDNVILGVPHQQAMDCSNELRHRAGGAKESQKESVQETSSHSPCGRLIRAVSSKGSCPKTVLQKVSMFEKLATKASKPKPKRLRQEEFPLQEDEFPEVTINMVGKGKSAVTSKVSNPDFSPGRKISSGIAQRMSQLQLEAVGHRDYPEIHEEFSSNDELSDSCSAIASDDTAPSMGQAREVFMITPDQVAQMIQDALAKQKENFQFEMDMAMQQMREMHDQQIRTLTNHQGETSRRNNADQGESDSDSDEERNANNQDSGGGPVALPRSHPEEKSGEDKMMKELEDKVHALISAQGMKKAGIPCPYPREWESIPYPSKFNMINFTPFDGKGSPTQHLVYFKSHLGVISGNEPLMVRSFVGTLRGAAFDWYRRLKPGSINSWDDMESSFLNNFFDDDTEVSIVTLLDEKQKDGESVDSFVKRFRNKAMNCRDPVTEEFILQTCHNNLSINVLEVLGVAPPKAWKELKERGEQAERFLKRKKAERGQPMAKASAAAGNIHQQQPWGQRETPKLRFQEEYSFDDDQVPAIFKYLLANNKIKLPPIMNQEEASNTSDPKYCAYHRKVHHPTKACITLKNNIQALVDAGVITPK